MAREETITRQGPEVRTVRRCAELGEKALRNGRKANGRQWPRTGRIASCRPLCFGGTDPSARWNTMERGSRKKTTSERTLPTKT